MKCLKESSKSIVILSKRLKKSYIIDLKIEDFFNGRTDEFCDARQLMFDELCVILIVLFQVLLCLQQGGD